MEKQTSTGRARSTEATVINGVVSSERVSSRASGSARCAIARLDARLLGQEVDRDAHDDAVRDRSVLEKLFHDIEQVSACSPEGQLCSLACGEKERYVPGDGVEPARDPPS